VGTGFPRPGGGPDWPPGGGAGAPRDPLRDPGRNLPTPRIDYVSSKDITIDYTIHKMGRSGIKAAHLFVQRPQGGAWEPAGPAQSVNLKPSDKDQSLWLKYAAKEEGTYGFYVVPESGAGQRADDPRGGDPPMVYVVVDWSKPHVKITDIQVRPGGSRGPLVDITWEVADQNLMPRPISLEYAATRDAAKWDEIKYQLDAGQPQADGRHTGRFTWEVPNDNLWHFWVRIRATDKAANTGEFVWDKEVIVDLEKPAAGINRVRGGNDPGGTGPGPGGAGPDRGSDPPPPRGGAGSGSLPPGGAGSDAPPPRGGSGTGGGNGAGSGGGTLPPAGPPPTPKLPGGGVPDAP
jgi:hypothetical protein